MKKKHLVLIAVVAVLIVVVTVAFAQLLAQNNKASNPSPSFPSSSTSQSLTPEEITTLKADSFELEIRDMFLPDNNANQMHFLRIDSNVYNSTVIAQYTANFANVTSVSETAFLGDIINYLNYATNGIEYQVYFNSARVENTFYLQISSPAYPQYDLSVSCTP